MAHIPNQDTGSLASDVCLHQIILLSTNQISFPVPNFDGDNAEQQYGKR